MLVDMLLLSPPWTITVLPALGLSGGIAFGYWFWIERCYAHNGWYSVNLLYSCGLLLLLTRLGIRIRSSRSCPPLAGSACLR